MRTVSLITTGGTIEKVYDERSGALANQRTIVHTMLGELRLEDIDVTVMELMSKDSLDMNESDRRRIADAVELAGAVGPLQTENDALQSNGVQCDGVVILHGTDTLDETGKTLHELLGDRLNAPVVLTGAMRPFEMKKSDALQNLTEAIFSTGTLSPGIYCVAHGRALRFPGVEKDRDRGTFVEASTP